MTACITSAHSRNGLRVVPRWRSQVRLVKPREFLPAGYVFDGEIVCLDEAARPVFNDLLFHRREPQRKSRESAGTIPRPKSAGIWLRGTGKFAGLGGEFDIHPSPILATETLTQASGEKIGTYHIAATSR